MSLLKLSEHDECNSLFGDAIEYRRDTRADLKLCDDHRRLPKYCARRDEARRCSYPTFLTRMNILGEYTPAASEQRIL